MALLLLAPHSADMLNISLNDDHITHDAANDRHPERWLIDDLKLTLGEKINLSSSAVVQELILDGNIGRETVKDCILTFDLQHQQMWFL